MLTVLLLVLLFAALAGGVGYRGGAYRNQGFGLGGVLLLVLLVLLLTGRLSV